MIDYERLATIFLDKYDLAIHADGPTLECPPWCDGNHIHGRHYEVSVMDKKEKRDTFTFDFWESERDCQNNDRPNNYTVLSMILSTMRAEPFDANEAILKSIQDFSKRAKKFFTEEELENLKNIASN